MNYGEFVFIPSIAEMSDPEKSGEMMLWVMLQTDIGLVNSYRVLSAMRCIPAVDTIINLLCAEASARNIAKICARLNGDIEG